MAINWNEIFKQIGSNPNERDIELRFILPLIEDLGYEQSEYCTQFATGLGKCAVDFAVRSNAGRKDKFHESKTEPDLLIEVKKPDEDITKQKHKRQLMDYFPHQNAQTAQFGILTDSVNIQLYRRHGRVVHPLTSALPLRDGRANETIAKIRDIIKKPKKALTVCVYNNKGGVGKTTTAVNLSATLALIGKMKFGKGKENHEGFQYNRPKKVLAMDFDSQRDLTKSLFMDPRNRNFRGLHFDYSLRNILSKDKIPLTQCLEENKSLREAMYPYIYKYTRAGKIVEAPLFDVIPANEDFTCYIKDENKDRVPVSKLRELLAEFENEYDYIVIDCPTQVSFYSRSGLYAADVLLIPVRHSDLASMHNAAKVITEIIPEINSARGDELTALPVFYNNERKDIRSEKFKGDEKAVFYEELRFIAKSYGLLERYFEPKVVIAASATISDDTFERRPAAYRSKKVRESYAELVKYYFLNPGKEPEDVLEKPQAVSKATKVKSLDADNVKTIRATIYKDGKVDQKEAEYLFKLNKQVSDAANDPSWKKLFVEALTDYVLKDEISPGVVDGDEAAYIIGKISPDQGIDDTELALLVNITAKAKSCHESFSAFVLEVLRAKVLADGIIDDSEAEMIRKVIFAPGSGAGKGIDRAEADFLFDLNDSISGASNSPKWKTLFVEAVSAHLLKKKTPKIDEKEAEWLIERVGRDGQFDDNGKALLMNIKSLAKEIHPKLKFFMDLFRI